MTRSGVFGRIYPFAGGGVSDHGLLTGLADDDHPQYHTDARADARYWPLSTDLATQPELDDEVSTRADADTALDSRVDILEVAPPAHAHAGEDITSGTVADARIASTIARDSEVTAAVAAHAAEADPHAGYVLESLLDAKGDLIVATAADTVARLAVGGTKGHVLKVNSAATPGVEWGPVVMRAYKSGLYYQTNQGPPADSTTIPVKDQVTYHAFPVYKDITIDRISLGVNTVGTAGAKVRLGIYVDDGLGLPGTLLLDAGTINGDSATYQQITVAQALAACTLYWVAIVWQVQAVGTGVLRASAVGAGSEWVGVSAATGDPRVCTYTQAGVTDALPASATPVATGNVTQSGSVKVRIV